MLVDLIVLAVVLAIAWLAGRPLGRAARARGVPRWTRVVWTTFGGVAFLTVLVTTAIGVTRLVAGPAAPDDCTGDECDENVKFIFPLFFRGLPAGIVVGVLAVLGLRRIAARGVLSR